jgi:hypothetical protein
MTNVEATMTKEVRILNVEATYVTTREADLLFEVLSVSPPSLFELRHSFDILTSTFDISISPEPESHAVNQRITRGAISDSNRSTTSG